MSRSLYARLLERYGPKVDGPSRREVLKASLASAAGIMISGCTSKTKRATPYAQLSPDARRIIVVGGGLAGLAAAHELVAAGYKVHLYEARNRLGGRVLTLPDVAAGKVVEGGGGFVGANHPGWAAFAKQFDLGLAPVTSDERKFTPIVIGGKSLDDRQGKALTEGR